MKKLSLFLCLLISGFFAFAQDDSILFAGEPHFKNVIQLVNVLLFKEPIQKKGFFVIKYLWV